jgi:hypothetical protein
MEYTSEIGRRILKSRHKVLEVVTKKWSGVLLATFKLRWENAWDSERIKKGSGADLADLA